MLELLALHGRLCSPPGHCGVRVVHRFSFLYCGILICCVRLLSCVTSVTSFSVLSIFDCDLDSLQRLFSFLCCALWIIVDHCGSLFVHFVLIHRELSLSIASSSLIVASTISPITTKTKNLTSY